MDFGSKYVYKYDVSSEESLSEDENESHLMVHPVPMISVAHDELLTPAAARPEAMETLDELGVPASPTSASASASSSAKPREKKKKRLRKADTNIVSIKFNKLLKPGEMHAGDAVYCSSCGAIASHLSRIETVQPEEGVNTSPKTQWKCEFCPQTNNVDIEQSDLPKKEDATYLIAPAPTVHGSDMTGVDDSIVIFVVDISGSMSSTTLVHGNFELPAALRQDERTSANFDGERLIRNRRQTYVSRLQGVQMAVEANLDKLVKDTPTRRAALITFNHEITYYGDGTRTEPLVIRGDKLNNFDEIVREAQVEQNQELKSVLETKPHLTERVYDLEEGGQTALGPAVLFALNIASKRRGSRIVICTDGLANRGLGSLESAQDEKISENEREQALQDGNEYYANITERARTDGTSISVITIKGTTCLLSVIGQMADGTGGSVTIVDLLNIREEFASILEQQIIATNAEATLIVHRGLYIRDPEQPEERLEKVKRDIGNVTKQTEITFEFGVRNKNELKEKYQIDMDNLKQLPFQIQVTYTTSDGSKALRVLTQLKESTADRQVAEVNARRGVIAENHIQSTAHYMMQYDDDDDEEESHLSKRSTKWSSPTVQKQRMMYMRKLNNERAERLSSIESDHFSETIWNKTSNDLKAHVDSSSSRARARKMAEKSAPSSMRKTAAPNTSLLNRVTGFFGFRQFDETASASAAAEPSPMNSAYRPSAPNPTSKPNRSYGFAKSKLSSNADRESEDLYRFKNFSSEMMRSASPPRIEPPTPFLPPPLGDVIETEIESTKKEDASKKTEETERK